MKMTSLISVLSLPLMASLSLASGQNNPTWTLEGFDQPESVLAGPSGQYLYVSNINGQPMELNQKGYISRITTTGKMETQQWVKGLNAPKGMAVDQEYLYVADMQKLHKIDLKKGNLVISYDAPKAGMLNDVTLGEDGSVYVSDMINGGIYRLKNDALALWFSDTKLPHPNGLAWNQGTLLIAGWGTGMQSDFSTEVPGTLYRLHPESLTLDEVNSGQKLGNLDGVVVRPESLLISDWISGEVFEVKGKERNILYTFRQGLADIGANKTHLFTPMMFDGSVSAWKL